jgi:very-short-patch-repair endonuclease
MLARGTVTTDVLLDWLGRHRVIAGRGGRRFERVLSLVDARAESPQESRLRVRLTLAGLRPPVVQHDIYDPDGRFVARVDLAWPQQKVAVEYDGVWHVGSAAQIHADRRRVSALASRGWTVLFVTSARLRDDFPGLAAEVRSALRGR